MRRIHFFEAHFGHDYGWHVEHSDVRIAELTTPVQWDQFWTRFSVVPITNDRKYLRILRNDLFWAKVNHRNRRFEDICFRTLTRCCADDEVIMRGSALFPTLPERLVLGLRRLLGFTRGSSNVLNARVAHDELLKQSASSNTRSAIVAIAPMESMFCELELLGFLHEPDFGSDTWTPSSPKCKALFERIIVPENRAT